MACQTCPAHLGSPEGLALHALCIHAGFRGPEWACGVCDFAASSIHNLLAHCVVLCHFHEPIQLSSSLSRPSHLNSGYYLTRDPVDAEVGRLKKFMRRSSDNEEPLESGQTGFIQLENHQESMGEEHPFDFDSSAKSEYCASPETLTPEHFMSLSNQGELEAPKLTSDRGSLRCSKCSYAARIKSRRTDTSTCAIQHVISCLKLRPFSCPACDKSSATKQWALLHARSACSTKFVYTPNR